MQLVFLGQTASTILCKIDFPWTSKTIMDHLIKSLRDAASGGLISESEETTNLHLTRDQFMLKMLREPKGQELLDLMEFGEWRVCERLGLCNGYIKDGVAWIDVPGWANLLAHLSIVNGV